MLNPSDAGERRNDPTALRVTNFTRAWGYDGWIGVNLYPFIAAAGWMRMLIALAQRDGLSSRQLGLRAGLSSKSGTFSTYLSKLRGEGWIEGSAASMRITQTGRVYLGGDFEPLPSGSELLAYWLDELGADNGAGRILTVLAKAFPHPLPHEQIGAQANISHKSGTYSTYLSRLRTLELIENCGRGEIRASAELFG